MFFQVEWRKADALLPETYSNILPKVGAVVHTLGTLLEDGKYKSALANGDVIGLIAAMTGGGGHGNPLDREPQRRSHYELINRDSGASFPDRRPLQYEFGPLNSALRVCEAFKSSKPDPDVTHVRPFVYISAEDIYRPLIPAGYIETKRETEQKISQLLRDDSNHRSVFIRPSKSCIVIVRTDNVVTTHIILKVSCTTRITDR